MSYDKTGSIIQIVKDFTGSLQDESFQTEDFSPSESSVEIDMLPNFEQARFEQNDLLGQGGMGAVYSAYDTVLHRDVAIKYLLEKTQPHSATWKRFYREAQITAQLSHPSIVPVYSIEFVNKKQPTLIMKKIKGITLTEYIRECKNVQETDDFVESRHGLFARLDIIIRICDAMNYAHSKGILHRDLKPDNVMVGNFEDVYVMDWGISCALDEDLEDLQSTIELTDLGLQTLEGSMMGTLTYMPPEQARGDLIDIHYYSDQYTLGLMLYELLTLERARPTKNVTKSEMIEKAIDGTWDEERFEETTKHLDPRLVAIIRKSTEPKGYQRYPSVAMLVQDLRRFTHNQAVWALPESRPRKIWRTLLNHPTVLLGLISVILFIATTSLGYAFVSKITERQKAEKHRSQSVHMLSLLQRDASQLDKIFLDVKERGEVLAKLIEKEVAKNNRQVECLFYNEIEKSPNAIRHRQYNDNIITIHEPACLLPASVSISSATIGLPIAHNIKEDLIQTYLGDIPKEKFLKEFPTQETDHDIQWVYAAFADGTLINYPGISQYGENYDPRKRPWYLNGKNYEKIKCGEPYPDASGIGYLLPCNRQLKDPYGNVIGVGGIDFTIDHLISQVEKTDFPRKIQVYLLNKRGQIIFSDAEKGIKVEKLKKSHKNRAKKLEFFPDEEILDSIMATDHQGIIESKDQLFLFSKLDFVPWTLVYEIDPDIWKCKECFE